MLLRRSGRLISSKLRLKHFILPLLAFGFFLRVVWLGQKWPQQPIIPNICSSPRAPRFVLMPIRFASWPCPKLARSFEVPRFHALEMRDLLHQHRVIFRDGGLSCFPVRYDCLCGYFGSHRFVNIFWVRLWSEARHSQLEAHSQTSGESKHHQVACDVKNAATPTEPQ